MSSPKRNLYNVIDGPPSKVISLRVDSITIEILEIIEELKMNKSQFIRKAILNEAIRKKYYGG